MPERSQSSDADPSLGLRAALLVEGASDQRALTLLARRHNRDLRADAVAVVAMRHRSTRRQELADGLAADHRLSGGIPDGAGELVTI